MARGFLKVLLAATLFVASASLAQARDQIKIVGSSTVFPFSSFVAEEFGATGKFKTPVVESTGTGGGFKLFTAGVGTQTPDISNASRRIKRSEFETAEQNGVTDISEALIGFDGIVVAQNKDAAPLNLTLQQLALAVLAEIPKDGKLIPNPYTSWDQISPDLPKRKIIVYGPPTSSGTRDAFEELVVEPVAHKLGGYEKGYKKIRQDNAYVPSGENDNLIVQKLTKDKEAVGVFGYSFYEENQDSLSVAKIESWTPNMDSIASGSYPISRSLYFYVKNAHYDKVPGLKEYVELFMSEKMIGDNGALKRIGLVPLPAAEREKARKKVLGRVKVTKEELK